MKSWSNREELEHEVVTLFKRGMAKRAIARGLNTSRNTVKEILKEHEARREAPQCAIVAEPARAPRATKLTPFAGDVAALMAQFPDITARRIFEELRSKGYEGGETAVKDYVREVRPPKKPPPSLPTPTYEPGQMAECDWSTYKVRFTNGTQITVQVFGYVLWYSRRRFYQIYERNDLYALMDGHVQAFNRFKGVAAICKYDNQKPVVLRWEGKQPLYNPRFLGITTYYEFRPHACHIRSPNEKPSVERGFWYFERNFLNGRTFRDLDDMRAQLARWQDEIADHHLHRTLKRTPLEMFAEEAPHLVPLPSHPYDCARVVYRTCSVDGFVDWDGNRYAVPYEAIYDLLPLRVTQREIFVYAADLRLLARHELAPRSSGKKVGSSNVHQRPERRGPDLDALRDAFEALGDGAADFFAGMLRREERQCGYHARQILLLRERFTSDDIVAALRHAHAFGAYEHLAVARILEARARPRTLDEYVAEEAATRIKQRWGDIETKPRDLREYDRLPVLSSAPVTKETPCHEKNAASTTVNAPSPLPRETPSGESSGTSTPSG